MEDEKKFVPIPLEKVNSTNSNVYKYSKVLGDALRRCRGNQNGYKESHSSSNITEFFNLQRILEKDIDYPYPDLDFQMDFEKFIEVYHEEDQEIFKLWLQGYTQHEIASKIGISQTAVYNRLAFLREEAEYYYGELYGE